MQHSIRWKINFTKFLNIISTSQLKIGLNWSTKEGALGQALFLADFSNLSPIVRRRGLSSLILATRFLPAFSSSSAAFLALLLLTSKALA